MKTGEKKKVGVSIHGASAKPAELLATIVRADQLGVHAFWLTSGPAGPDPLTLLAAAAPLTKKITLAQSVVPTMPRHPLILVQQAQVVANLAPGRFVLGLGPGHPALVTPFYGIPFERPLEQLREYVHIVRAALCEGTVDFDGERFQVHARVANTAAVPIMTSGLRRKSYLLAGELADGAITWLCPARYLSDVALPALQEGAARANRSVPPLVGQAFIAVSKNVDEVRKLARERLAVNLRLPFYRQMLVAAGFPEAANGELSDRLLDAVVIHGNEHEVADGLRSFMVSAGASEMIASILLLGDERDSTERSLQLVANL